MVRSHAAIFGISCMMNSITLGRTTYASITVGFGRRDSYDMAWNPSREDYTRAAVSARCDGRGMGSHFLTDVKMCNEVGLTVRGD